MSQKHQLPKTLSTGEVKVADASQPTERIAKIAIWLHLSRVSPALHPPARKTLTYSYLKTRFRREKTRGREICRQQGGYTKSRAP